MTILADIGESVALSLVLDDGAIDQFPQVRVFRETGSTPIATISLDHVADGMYRTVTPFTPTTAEKFTLVFIVFTDVARTIESSAFSRSTDTLTTDYLPTLVSGLPPRT